MQSEHSNISGIVPITETCTSNFIKADPSVEASDSADLVNNFKEQEVEESDGERKIQSELRTSSSKDTNSSAKLLRPRALRITRNTPWMPICFNIEPEIQEERFADTSSDNESIFEVDPLLLDAPSAVENSDTNAHSPCGLLEWDEWRSTGLKLAITAVLHPLEYTKLISQLGYVTFPHQSSIWPSSFQCIAHIRKLDGFVGCYRGVTPVLLGTLLNTYLSKRLALKLDNHVLASENTTSASFICKRMGCEAVVATAAVVAYQPFYVISLRMMAQFVGHEQVYKSIWRGVVEIYRHEGFTGFFAGLSTKLAYELLCLTLSTGTIFVVSKYILKSKEDRHYTPTMIMLLYSQLLHPLRVISACMAVSGSRLRAASPPFMPRYSSAMDCYKDLRMRGQLYRGGSLFWATSRASSAHKVFEAADMESVLFIEDSASNYVLPDIGNSK